jgi:hypothetical protein
MNEMADVGVRIVADEDDDDQELSLLTARLRSALLDLDVQNVVPAIQEGPPGSKAGVTAVLGWLWVTLGGEALKVVVDRAAGWAVSNGRSVEVSVNGNTLKLTRVSPQEQRELIDTWLAHLPADAAGNSAPRA